MRGPIEMFRACSRRSRLRRLFVEEVIIINERAQLVEIAERMGHPDVADAIRERGLLIPIKVHPLLSQSRLQAQRETR